MAVVSFHIALSAAPHMPSGAAPAYTGLGLAAVNNLCNSLKPVASKYFPLPGQVMQVIFTVPGEGGRLHGVFLTLWHPHHRATHRR